MPVSLPKDLRTQLARTTLEARKRAEAAARAALEHLAVHEAAPAAPLKVPAGHAICASEPAGQKKPASQVAEHALVERPVTAPYVPAGHSSGAREPTGQ